MVPSEAPVGNVHPSMLASPLENIQPLSMFSTVRPAIWLSAEALSASSVSLEETVPSSEGPMPWSSP